MHDDKRKIGAIIEARMTSTRLPGKVLMPLAGKPALERIIERLKRSQYLDEVIVATTANPDDDAIVSLAEKLKIRYFRGSENDVLDRVLKAAQTFEVDIIVEITGDCPLVDWRLVDRGIDELLEKQLDYSANNTVFSYPDGFDVRVFKSSVLEKASELTSDPIDHVHVSTFIPAHPEIFKTINWVAEPDCHRPEWRLTLDEAADYRLIDLIFSRLLPVNEDFSAREVIDFLNKNPELLEINKNVKAKEIQEG